MHSYSKSVESNSWSSVVAMSESETLEGTGTDNSIS